MNKKQLEYASKVLGVIQSIFEEDSEFHLNKEELLDSDNLTDFIHVIANVVPCRIFNNFTGEENNHLEFNHIANSLCFQYMKEPK